MKYYLFLFICLLFMRTGYAQSNYQAGLVVTSAGDTVRGYINYKEWEQNPENIAFKTALTDENARDYKPKNVRYFEITGQEAYLRYDGEISADRVDLDNLGTRISNKTRTVSTFFKVLQRGDKITLLSFADVLKTRYFMQDGKTGYPQELIYKKFIDEKGQIATVNGYTKQLWNAATKYGISDPAFKKRIDNTQYNGSELIKIVGTINGLTKKQLDDIEKSQDKVTYFWGFGLNRSVSAVTTKNTYNQLTTGSIMPKLAIGGELYLNPNVQRLALRGELALTFNNQEASFSQIEDDAERQFSLRFNQATVSLSPQLIYNIYNQEKFKFYLGSGFTVNYSKYFKVRYTEKLIPSDGKDIDSNKYADLYKMWLAVPVRVGFLVKQKADISFLYYPASAVTSTNKYALKMTSLHLQVNYILK